MSFITTIEAAEKLSISERRVRQLIAEGKLSAIKLGRDYVIDEVALERVTTYGKAGRPKIANSIQFYFQIWRLSEETQEKLEDIFNSVFHGRIVMLQKTGDNFFLEYNFETPIAVGEIPVKLRNLLARNINVGSYRLRIADGSLQEFDATTTF